MSIEENDSWLLPIGRKSTVYNPESFLSFSQKMRSRLAKYLISALSCLLFLSGSIALANEATEWLNSLRDTREPEPAFGSSRSKQEPYTGTTAGSEPVPDKYGTLNFQNAVSLRGHAAAKLKAGLLDDAILLIEQAIELQPEDTNGRQIYADALERRLRSQTEQSPHTFNLCVKQWYYLFRNAEYSDLVNTAAIHLRELTGKSPHLYPTPHMYLSRVLRPELSAESLSARRSPAEDEPAQVR